MKKEYSKHSKNELELTPELNEIDESIFREVISTQLTPTQKESVVLPPFILPEEKDVLAIHWHPEFIHHQLIAQRISGMFPNAQRKLIIPTQHNVIESWDGCCGVEVDCYSQDFNRKVQLLIHFSRSQLRKTNKFKKILQHTFNYRASQLWQFIETILDPRLEHRLHTAAQITGSSPELIKFVRIYVEKIRRLIQKYESEMPKDAFKNKLLRNYFDSLRKYHQTDLIDRSQLLLNAVKELVKCNFDLKYFYEIREIIEEARSINAGIVIPHPEQFWPILLADYDVDGIEVWNPQSREFTHFLVDVVRRKNETRSKRDRRFLVFMGDDTHMSEKVRELKYRAPEKANREIGYQPAWEDPEIQKALVQAKMNKKQIIDEYFNRLN